MARIEGLKMMHQLRDVATAAAAELESYQVLINQHRQECACKETEISLRVIHEYKFAIAEMVKRIDETATRTEREVAVLNGDKTQLS